MSHSDYFEWLLKVGMGWLGWTEQQCLDTTMPAIVLAREGRAQMIQDVLNGVFGKPEPEPPKQMISDDAIKMIIHHVSNRTA